MRAGGAAGEAVQRAEQALERGEIDAVVAHLSSAVRNYAAAGDVTGEAMASVRLGMAMANGLSNRAASRAWFARARRLVTDLPPQYGATPALVEDDIVGPATAEDDGSVSRAPHTAATLRGLGDLEPRTLALMHGPSFAGDGRRALYELADAYA